MDFKKLIDEARNVLKPENIEKTLQELREGAEAAAADAVNALNQGSTEAQKLIEDAKKQLEKDLQTAKEISDEFAKKAKPVLDIATIVVAAADAFVKPEAKKEEPKQELKADPTPASTQSADSNQNNKNADEQIKNIFKIAQEELDAQDADAAAGRKPNIARNKATLKMLDAEANDLMAALRPTEEEKRIKPKSAKIRAAKVKKPTESKKPKL